MSEDEENYEGSLAFKQTLFVRFAQTIDNLVALNIAFQNSLPLECKETLNPVTYAFQHATVHVDIGRQVGKTSYIKAAASDGVLVVCPHASARMSLLKDMKDVPSKPFILNGGNEALIEQTLEGKKFSFIIFDDPSELSEFSLFEVYRMTAGAVPLQVYILLGA